MAKSRMTSIGLLTILRPNIVNLKFLSWQWNSKQDWNESKASWNHKMSTVFTISKWALAKSSEKLTFIGTLETSHLASSLTDFPPSRCVRQTHFHIFPIKFSSHESRLSLCVDVRMKFPKKLYRKRYCERIFMKRTTTTRALCTKITHFPTEKREFSFFYSTWCMSQWKFEKDFSDCSCGLKEKRK